MTRNLPRTFLALFAALCLLATLGAFAQLANGPGHGPGRGPGNGQGAGFGQGDHHAQHFGRLARYLELTDEQIADAKAIFEDTKTQAMPLHDDVQALREELGTLLDEASPDAAAVGELVIEIHGIHEQIRDLREAAWDAFKALLTAEQLDKLEQLQAMREELGMGQQGAGPGPGAGFGPGAGGGPGGGSGFGPGAGL